MARTVLAVLLAVNVANALRHSERQPSNNTLKDEVEVGSPPVSAPEHGYFGKDVEHENWHTATGDWAKEYGPKGHSSHPKPHKSGAAACFIPFTLLLPVCVVTAML